MRWVSVGVLVGVPFLVLGRGFGGPDVLLGLANWDMTFLFYPQRLFAIASLRAGDFPLWNPSIFCGIPFHATTHPGLLYPPNLLFLILPTALSFNLLFALHLGLAGLFTFALLRELGARRGASMIGAFAFALSARFILHVQAGHFPHVLSLAWMPGLFWLAERLRRAPSWRSGALLAGAFALSIFAGFPQYSVYAAVGVGLIALGRALRRPAGEARALLRVIAAFAGGGLLAAAQVLPALEYARSSFRAHQAAEFLQSGYLPLANLATLLLPSALGDMARAPYFGEWSFVEMCAYAGVGTIVFAALALVAGAEPRRRALPWIALAAIATLLALGSQTPLWALLRSIPVLGAFRGSSKFIALALLGLAVGAGLGVDALSARRRLYPLLGALALIGAATWAAFHGDSGLARASSLYQALGAANSHFPAGPPAASAELIDAVRASLQWSAARLVIICVALAAAAAGRLATPLVGAVLLADLFLFANAHVKTVSVENDVRLDPELAAAIASTPASTRFGASERRMMRGVIDGALAIGGYEGNLPARTVAFMNVAAGRPVDAPVPTFQPRRLSPLLDLMVMQRLVLEGAAPVDTLHYRFVTQGRRFALYERTRPLPRAYLAPSVELAPDPQAVWTDILRGRRDPFRTATVERAADLRPLAPPATAPGADEPAHAATPTADARDDGPDRVVVHASPTERSLLVLLDAYAPGWRATVDGRDARIVAVFGFFRGVYLDAGDREVIFSYRPRSMTAGVLLSISALTVIVLLLTTDSLRRRRR